MTFESFSIRSGFVSLVAACITGAVAILLIKWLPQQSDLLAAFKILAALLLALVAWGMTIYWTVVAFRLRYHLSRNGLVIHWGLAEYMVPFESIAQVIPGKDVPFLPFTGFNLAGLRLGSKETAEFGQLRFYATAGLANSLLVVTPGQAYVISPRQPEAFLKAWQARRALGPTQQWTTGIRRHWPSNNSVLADPLTGWLLGLAVLACLALLGYLAMILPQLPPSLPIHFNAFGRADRIADKSALLTLPAAGALVLLVNTVLGSLIYRWEKVATYLLWGSAIIMQICLWIATFMIIR